MYSGERASKALEMESLNCIKYMIILSRITNLNQVFFYGNTTMTTAYYNEHNRRFIFSNLKVNMIEPIRRAFCAFKIIFDPLKSNSLII